MISSGKETIKQTEPGTEKDTLKHTVEDIEKRWTTLHSKVTKRNTVIHKLYPVAKQFNNEFEKLLPWLMTADKELRVIQPLSSQPEILVQQKRAIEVNISFLLTSYFFQVSGFFCNGTMCTTTVYYNYCIYSVVIEGAIFGCFKKWVS